MGLGNLERYEVRQQVGQGASGIVFRASDRDTGADVALKVINAAGIDAADLHRLEAEGQLLRQFEHPNIVRVFDHGTVGDDSVTIDGTRFAERSPFVAMEWLEGMDLGSRHAKTPLTLPESLECSRQIASALDAAHAAGVVHRDVKPSNVFVVANAALPRGDSLQFKLVDFGVAMLSTDGLAEIGSMIGTPAYMAPEQARADGVVAAPSDIYALGATLFELLAGRTPHVGDSAIALLAKLVSTPARRLREVMLEVPEALDNLVAEMLNLDAGTRPQAMEVGERLHAIAADPALPVAAAAIDSQDLASLSSVSRLVTTLVVLKGPKETVRDEQLDRMRETGAEAAPLGSDSIVAYLGARQAHGSEAVQAIQLGRELSELGAAVGVATGRALVNLARPVGEVVDRASELAREAAAGEMFADETTAELARERFAFEQKSSGNHRVGQSIVPRRGRSAATPFVGREDELARLFKSYEACVTEKRARVVSVAGPPGIGKTRLGREFVSELIAGRVGPAPRVIRANCLAYGRARALGTVADILSDMLRIPKGASSFDIAQQLEDFRLIHDEKGLLASLIAGEPFPEDIAAHRARDILYLAMTELMFKVCQRDPCVILLEDLQWSDSESVAWFAHLLSRFASRPLLVLVLARPGFFREHRDAFPMKDHQRVDLRPIPRQATLEIARALVSDTLSEEKLMQIAVKAAGSPLFAEELARVVAAGRSEVNVPTIEAAIQVSLDALDVDAREALARFSILGTACWSSALGSLGVGDEEPMLKRLCDAEIIVEQEQSRFAGTREFWFKHALVRDVVYASVSEALRGDLHGRAAAWLARVGEDAATVAEHYDLGNEHGMAAGFWERAARRALAANSLQAAVSMADRALTFATEPRTIFARASLLNEIHSRLDERSAERAEAIETMTDSAYDDASELRAEGAQARYDLVRSAGVDVERRLTEVTERAAALGLIDEQARCVATLTARYAFAGDLKQAQREAERLLELARQHGLPSAAVDGWQTLAVVHQTRGQLAAALEARRNAARAARTAGLKNREAMLTINLGFALTTIGAKEDARAEIEAGLAMAEEIGSIGTVRLGRMILLGWSAHFGADDSLASALDEPRQSADEAALGGWIPRDRVTLGVLFYRGCELVSSGDQADLKRACSLLALAAEAYRQTENRDVLPVALGYWAEAMRQTGDIEEAERIGLEAMELVEAGAPSLLNESIIYLALAGVRLDMGDFEAAQKTIERAIPVLVRRVQGLSGTAYERQFLMALPDNARLLESADSYGFVPDVLTDILRGDPSA